jgi:hypothetical protein
MTYLASSMPARSIEGICLAIVAGVSRSFLNQNNDQESAWDYYTIKETVPGDEAFQPLSEFRCRLVTR